MEGSGTLLPMVDVRKRALMRSCQDVVLNPLNCFHNEPARGDSHGRCAKVQRGGFHKKKVQIAPMVSWFEQTAVKSKKLEFVVTNLFANIIKISFNDSSLPIFDIFSLILIPKTRYFMKTFGQKQH